MSHDQPNPLEADTERIRLVLGLLEKHGAVTWAKLRSGLGEDPHPAIRSFNKFYDDKGLRIEQNRDTYPITFSPGRVWDTRISVRAGTRMAGA